MCTLIAKYMVPVFHILLKNSDDCNSGLDAAEGHLRGVLCETVALYAPHIHEARMYSSGDLPSWVDSVSVPLPSISALPRSLSSSLRLPLTSCAAIAAYEVNNILSAPMAKYDFSVMTLDELTNSPPRRPNTFCLGAMFCVLHEVFLINHMDIDSQIGIGTTQAV